MRKTVITLLSLMSFFTYSAKGTKKQGDIQFFVKQSQKKGQGYSFNEYENLISGLAAFSIGNVGYLVSDSASLKLAYSGIQTIGIINIGKGVYLMNSSNVEESLAQLMTNKRVKGYSKSKLSSELIKIYAKDERAKRLSIFYSSSFLTFQYLLNATVYDSPKKVENIYIFLAGINAMIAGYTGLFKTDYEKHYYGDSLDIQPFAFQRDNAFNAGLSLSYSF